MAGIAEIPGIGGPTLELFRAAGIETSADMVALSVEDLHSALGEVNADQQLVPQLPGKSALETWQKAAQILEGTARGGSREVALPSSVMARTHVAGLPVAELVPSQQLRSAGIKASSVPIGRLVERVAGGLRLAESDEENAETTPELPEPEEDSLGGAKTVDVPRPLLQKPVQQLQTAPIDRENQPMAFPVPGEERKAKGDIERRNHGMSHKEPMRVYLGAIAALLSILLVLIGFAGIASALARALYFEKQVTIHEALVLTAFPIALLLYVSLAMRPRCRLCGQRLFIPRQCRKHQRAHKSIFGYLFAMSTHLLFRGWFRCMLCGTKQRLGERD